MQKQPTLSWESAFSQEEKEAKKTFFTFLSFPSVSAQAEGKQGIEACCNWLYKEIDALGFHVEKWATEGHPILFAECLEAGPDKPTLLMYNHYDVQPVDPESEWETPPFEPTEKDGKIYARGAQDNKGQCGYVLQALKLWRKHKGEFPFNVKWLIEGEEEIGSFSLSKILEKKKDALQADTVAIIDLGLHHPDEPVLSLGVRGIVCMDVNVKESNVDLHSGFMGGAVQNPLHVLSKILASLHDESGKVTVPCFYDDVDGLSSEEEGWLDFNFDEAQFKETFGIQPLGGERAFSPLERIWIRPTLEINGIRGGYAGDGFKTVIPSKAQAKVSCRLVPNQDPQKIGQLVKEHIESLAPDGVTLWVDVHPGSGPGIRTKPTTSGVNVFSQAYSEVFGKPCHFILEGGSIPIVPELARTSGAEIVLMGLGLASDLIHAPNEHFGWDRYKKGTLIMLHAFEAFGKGSS